MHILPTLVRTGSKQFLINYQKQVNGDFCENIDECEQNEHNCHENAHCTDNEGSFDCDCNSGFSGNGTFCENIDECANGDHNCDQNAICSDAQGSSSCKCKDGYRGNGTVCENIDECQEGR